MNEERFLEETITSVIHQDYKNWELLLVDDGSTNRSTDIAKKYAAENPGKIYYYDHEEHKNLGVCATRNLGVEKANGNLIAFLDADDYFLPQKLSKQVGYFLKYPDIGMVAEASDYWYDWQNANIENQTIRVGGVNDKVIHPPQLLYDLYPLSSGDAPCPCSLMIKKDVIQRVGGFETAFKKEYQLYEDQAFLVKIYLSEKVYISSDSNNLYRQRPDSVVYRVHGSGQYHKVRKYFLKWLEAYLKQQGYNDEKIFNLMKQSLKPYRWPLLYQIKNFDPSKIYHFLRGKFTLLMNLYFIN